MKQFKMNLKNKKEYFLVCCFLHWVQVYQEIFLAGKGAIATSQEQGVNRVGEGIARASYANKKFQKTTTKNKMVF